MPWPWKPGTCTSIKTARPTLVVRQGKGRKARVVPVHPELQTPPDRGHQLRDSQPRQTDRSFPGHSLEVGAARGPSGH